MDAFLSFHAPGFWLVMALLGGVMVFGIRPFISTSAQTPVIVAYWVLVPYLALISGGVSPRLMELVYIDWAISLRIGVGLALALIVLALGMRAATVSSPAKRGEKTARHQSSRVWVATLTVIGLCGTEEFFWAFLRGAIAELLANPQISLTSPGYWAIWIAALLATPAALINTTGSYSRLIKATILVISSIVFFYTRNFWLCWLMHVAVWLIFLQPQRAPYPPNGHPVTSKVRTPTTERSQLQQ